jgi:CHAT domain-containing protein
MTKFVLRAYMLVTRLLGLIALGSVGVAIAQGPSNSEDLPVRPGAGTTAELEQQADLPNPIGDQPTSRCIVLYKRGVANSRLGRYERAIADLKEALALTNPGDRSPYCVQRGMTVRCGDEFLGEACARWRVEDDLRIAYRAIGDQFASIELLQTMSQEWRTVDVMHYAYTQLSLTDVYVTLGMLGDAEEAFTRASQVLPQVRMRSNWRIWQNNVNDAYSAHAAMLQELHGNYAEAEKFRRASLTYAEQHLAESNEPVRKEIAKENVVWRTYQLSAILLTKGESGEAEYFASEALSKTLATYAFGTLQTSLALKNLAMIKLDRGQIGEAARYGGLALEALAKSDVADYSTSLADRRAELALIRNMQGRWEDALQLFELREQGLRRNPDQWKVYRSGHLEWAMALLKTGHADRAVRMLRDGLNYRLKLPFDPPLDIAYFQTYLGVALAAQGDDDEALRYFQLALPILLQQVPGGGGNEGSGQIHLYRLRLVLDSYLELLGRLHGRERAGLDWTAEAFRIADIARESSVQQAVAGSAARAQLPDPALAELARREQDDTNQIRAVSNVLDSTVSEKQHSDQAIASLQHHLVDLTAERASLRNQIAQRFPDYANLINPRPATPADVQRVLQQGEALVSIYSGEHQTYVWTMTPTNVSWRIVPLNRAQITDAVARVRKSLGLEDGGVKPFDVEDAHTLYGSLLAPDAAMWAHATVLNVVPHGALGTLPFSILLTAPTHATTSTNRAAYAEMPWLINQVAIVQQSSASSLLAQRSSQLPPGERLPFVGFGDPLFAAGTAISDKRDIHVRQLRVPAPKDALQPVVEQAQQTTQPLVREAQPNIPTLAQAFALLPPLPDTADELSDIAHTLGANPQDDLYLRARASKANVKRIDLSRYRVIAFATHGLEAGELSGLDEPALALANPELTHESGDDGFLKLEDVLGLRLNADWVILSACNTASPDGSTNEAVSGLGRGFFYAGARSVLVSNWAVESRSARLLTTGLFIEQANHPDMTRAEALRRSMLDLMRRYPAEYGHPVFWGPFSLVGDGR